MFILLTSKQKAYQALPISHVLHTHTHTHTHARTLHTLYPHAHYTYTHTLRTCTHTTHKLTVLHMASIFKYNCDLIWENQSTYINGLRLGLGGTDIFDYCTEVIMQYCHVHYKIICVIKKTLLWAYSIQP